MIDDSATRTDHYSKCSVEQVAQVPVLTVVHHPNAALVGSRHLLRDGDKLVLGRTATCFGPRALDESRISRRHLEVVRVGGRVCATDLGSRNGSLVNGERIREAELALGDAISLGGVILMVHLGPVFHELPRHPTLLGIGGAIGRVITQIERAAPGDVTLLIQGETGSGKELVARALHEASGRAGSFVPINCGALAEGVVHSELFGHERGAFSGAGVARNGLVDAAAGGTLFLDEIADASLTLQTSLLRLLETGDYRQVGSNRLLHADARFVAATHVPLETAVESRGFRDDLHSRLNRIVIPVPPLRERREDILPLANVLAARIAGHQVAISRPLAIAMLRYGWPQNVRELLAVIEQALLERDDAAAIKLTDTLASRLSAQPVAAAAPRASPQSPGADALRAQLSRLGGNVKALAAEHGVARTTVYRWLRAAGIDPKSARG